jgi:hypothetical protein
MSEQGEPGWGQAHAVGAPLETRRTAAAVKLPDSAIWRRTRRFVLDTSMLTTHTTDARSSLFTCLASF